MSYSNNMWPFYYLLPSYYYKPSANKEEPKDNATPPSSPQLPQGTVPEIPEDKSRV